MAKRNVIDLPNDWAPRPYQLDLWRYLEGGGKRAVAVWHRRAGKDSLALNWTCCAAHQRVGVYWHMLPEARQARKVVWDGIDGAGRKVIDQVFPPEVRTGTNDQEMRITLKSGSVWQCVGSDNYNALVGSNPVGIVFSEYSVADPAAWDYIRPILAENGGWAVFIYTPRGHNHGWRMFENARRNKDWFAQLHTVESSGAIPLSIIDDERASGMDEAQIQQEYYCSFESAVRGSYFGGLMGQASARIKPIPYEPTLPVTTGWDLGMGDSTAIWFHQGLGTENRLIDYYENSGCALDHYAKVLREKPYSYKEHILPHDVEVSELGTGRRRIDILRDLGIGKVRVVPRMSHDDSVQAIRAFIPKCWFDDVKCARGLDALRQYQREWVDKLNMFRDVPLHDWSSHGVDAFRMLAVGLRERRLERVVRQEYARAEYAEF